MELDNVTLMMAIQAVNSKIQRYDQLLNNSSLVDKDDVRTLLHSYQKTLVKLKQAYISTGTKDGFRLLALVND